MRAHPRAHRIERNLGSRAQRQLASPATRAQNFARGHCTAPNRARSNRAIEAAIISMAQQARPNVSGHTEFARPQLYNSCKDVT